jgi:cytochrome c peroxidase
MKRLLPITITASALLVGCLGDTRTDEEKSSGKTLDDQLKTIISAHELTGDPSTGRTLPTIESSKAQLGMKLFFSKALSGEMDTACASCHLPALGGGDGLSLPIGVDAVDPNQLGPKRRHSSSAVGYDAGPTVPRNSPTTFNIGLWDQVFFHDGRVQSLNPVAGSNGNGTDIQTPDSANGVADPEAGANLTAAQARFPVTSPEEMKGHVKHELDRAGIRDYLVKRLRGEDNKDLTKNEWLTAFQEGYNSNASASALITEENMFGAIAEYERSQVFVDNDWKAYIEAVTAQDDDSDEEEESATLDTISDAAKRGAVLFFNTVENGGANCASCHSGDFFTDEKFHNIAMPQIGRGKGDGLTGSNDFGRFKVTGVESDKFKFRTPSLLNVALTGPYGHSGAYDSLEQVVRHHLNVEEAVNAYDVSGYASQVGLQSDDMQDNTSEALQALLDAKALDSESTIQDVDLTDSQVSQLIAFLRTLTDACVENAEDKSCLEKWVPSNDLQDPDGIRLEPKI